MLLYNAVSCVLSLLTHYFELGVPFCIRGSIKAKHANGWGFCGYKLSVLACASVSFLKLAKLMIVCCRLCQNSHIVTVICVKWSLGFKTWTVWTWRPWSLFKPREHSCTRDILMQSDKDIGHRVSVSLSPPILFSIMCGFRNSHTYRGMAWWGPWNVIMSLQCEWSMKYRESGWRLTGLRWQFL